MRFVYHAKAGESVLELSGDVHHYLFCVRRLDRDKVLELRNLVDCKSHFYKIQNISKKVAFLELLHSSDLSLNPKGAHLIWAVIEPKNIEGVLPFLNELNVRKISFFYADFSQKKYNLNMQRMQRILQNSSQQCGRGDFMLIENFETLEQNLNIYPNAIALNFSDKTMECKDIASFLNPICIGAEGGFSAREVQLLRERKIPIFTAPTHILQSHTASVFAATLATLA